MFVLKVSLKDQVTGTFTKLPLYWPVRRSNSDPPETASPSFPVSGGRMFILALGRTLLPPSPSCRARAAMMPSSTGRNSETTQAGVTRPRKSRLLAKEAEDFDLAGAGLVDCGVVDHEGAARCARLAGKHGRDFDRRGEHQRAHRFPSPGRGLYLNCTPVGAVTLLANQSQ